MSRQAWRSLSSLKVEEELAAGEGGKHQLARGGQPVWGPEAGELRASRGVSPPCVMQSGGEGPEGVGRLVKVPRGGRGPRAAACTRFCGSAGPLCSGLPKGPLRAVVTRGLVTQGLPTLVPDCPWTLGLTSWALLPARGGASGIHGCFPETWGGSGKVIARETAAPLCGLDPSFYAIMGLSRIMAEAPSGLDSSFQTRKSVQFGSPQEVEHQMGFECR